MDGITKSFLNFEKIEEFSDMAILLKRADRFEANAVFDR